MWLASINEFWPCSGLKAKQIQTISQQISSSSLPSHPIAPVPGKLNTLSGEAGLEGRCPSGAPSVLEDPWDYELPKFSYPRTSIHPEVAAETESSDYRKGMERAKEALQL